LIRFNCIVGLILVVGTILFVNEYLLGICFLIGLNTYTYSLELLDTVSMDSYRSFYSLASAANEVLNTFSDHITDGFGWVADRGREHTHCLKNAFFKAGGRLIVNKWDRINKSYMRYLHELTAGKAST